MHTPRSLRSRHPPVHRRTACLPLTRPALPHWLHPTSSAPRVAVDVAATAQTHITVAVTPPDGTVAVDFTKFVLHVCVKGADPEMCRDDDCDVSLAAACPVGDLTDGTAFTVTATALKGDTTSPASVPAEFTTLRYP